MGWGSLLAFGPETTWGTRVTATSAFEFSSESLRKDIEEKKLESIGTGRAFARRVQTSVNVAGPIEWDLHPVDAVALFKHALMGTVTSTQVGATPAYNHTFTAGDMTAIAQRGLSFEKRVGGDTSTAFIFTGCRVNSWKLTGAIGEPVKSTMEFIGRDATTGTFFTSTVAYSTIRPFLFQDVTFFIDGTIASMTATSTEHIVSFELEVNNNLQAEEASRSIGNTVLTALPPGRREIKFSFTQRYDTTTAWSRFVDGTRQAIRLRLDTGQTIGAALTTYAMFIDLPAVYFNSAVPEIGDSGIITHDVEVSAIADTTTNSGIDITLSLTNAATTYV